MRRGNIRCGEVQLHCAGCHIFVSGGEDNRSSTVRRGKRYPPVVVVPAVIRCDFQTQFVRIKCFRSRHVGNRDAKHHNVVDLVACRGGRREQQCRACQGAVDCKHTSVHSSNTPCLETSRKNITSVPIA